MHNRYIILFQKRGDIFDDVFLSSAHGNCSKCLAGKLKNPANYLCRTCRKVFCADCTRRHVIRKICGDCDVENIQNNLRITSVGEFESDCLRMDIFITHLNPRKKKNGVVTRIKGTDSLMPAKKPEILRRTESLLKISPMTTPRLLLTEKMSPRPGYKIQNTPRSDNSGIIKDSMMRDFQRFQATQEIQLQHAHLAFKNRFSCIVERQEKVGPLGNLACTERNCLLILDKANDKLKLFDEKFICQISMPIPTGCWCMTVTKNNTIAITHKNKIKMYQLVRRETQWYEKPRRPYIEKMGMDITLRGMCYGIAFCVRTNQFFVSCDVFFSDPSMHMISEDGMTQKIVRWSSRLQGGNPFTEHFTLDETKNCLYLSDYRGKRVVCMTYEGEFCWVVPMKGLPGSLMTLGDYIFLIEDSRCLCLLHREGKYIKSVLDVDYEACQISYNEVKNTIYISGTYWGVSHFIHMYEII